MLNGIGTQLLEGVEQNYSERLHCPTQPVHYMLGLHKHVDDKAQEHSSWRWMRMESQESLVHLRKPVRLQLRST